jgi:hypothetical protein
MGVCFSSTLRLDGSGEGLYKAYLKILNRGATSTETKLMHAWMHVGIPGYLIREGLSGGPLVSEQVGVKFLPLPFPCLYVAIVSFSSFFRSLFAVQVREYKAL